jgi:hypothetical protein
MSTKLETVDDTLRSDLTFPRTMNRATCQNVTDQLESIKKLWIDLSYKQSTNNNDQKIRKMSKALDKTRINKALRDGVKEFSEFDTKIEAAAAGEGFYLYVNIAFVAVNLFLVFLLVRLVRTEKTLWVQYAEKFKSDGPSSK